MLRQWGHSWGAYHSPVLFTAGEHHTRVSASIRSFYRLSPSSIHSFYRLSPSLHARSIGLALYWPIRLVSTLSSTHFEWRRVSADMKLVPDLAWIKPRHPCFFSDRLYTLQNNNLSPHKALSCLLPRLCLWNLEFNLSMYPLSLRWQEPVVTFKTLMEMFPHPPTIQWSQGSSQQVINANKQ